MATYSFGITYLENFQVEVKVSGIAQPGATVAYTTANGNRLSTTDANGLSNAEYLFQSQPLSIVVEAPGFPQQTENITYTFSTDLQRVVVNIIPEPSINLDAENKFSFYRFSRAFNLFIQGGQLGSKDAEDDFEAITESVLSLVDCKGDAIPNNYRRGKQRFYTPPFFRDDEISFILNFTLDFGGDDINDIELGIINNAGALVGDPIALNSLTCNTTDYYYVSFVFPILPNGSYYWFVIHNTVTEQVYYVSNPFRNFLAEDKECFPLLSYRNSCDIFNNGYECLTTVRNTIRLDINLVEQQPEIEIRQYREQSTGKLRNQRSQTAKICSVETKQFDDGSNDAMFSLSVHDDILINERDYEVKTAHRIITSRKNPLQDGIIELYDQEYSTINL